MAKIHEIGIGADTRAFEDNIKRGVIRPAEEAEKALEELGHSDAGSDAARDLEKVGDALKHDVVDPAADADRALKELGDTRAGTEAANDLAKLERQLKDAQEQSERTDRSIDDIGSGGRSSFGRMGEAAQEVTQEVGQNLGEAVSSVRGNISDLGQVGQDTLGGLAATLAGTGPAGIAGAAALAAGAVGLGLVTAEIENQNERVQQLKEYFSEAWRAAVEGGRDYIDTATVIGEMNDIIFNPDRAEEYKRIQEDAKTLDLDRVTLLQAAAGEQDSLNAVTERLNQLVEEQNELVTDATDIRTRGRGPKDAAAAKELADLQNINSRWKEYGDVSAENQQKAREAADATSRTLLKAVEDADSATVAVDDFGNKLIELPDGQEVVIDAKTGRATSDVSKFKTDTDGVINHLNGRDIVMKVRADTSDAERRVRMFMEQERNVQIGARIVLPRGERVLP